MLPKGIAFQWQELPDPYNDIYLKIPKAAFYSLESAAGLTHACKITEK